MITITCAVALVLSFTAVLLRFGRLRGQHSPAGHGTLGVSELCARIESERQRDEFAATYSRHVLRAGAFIPRLD